MTAEIKDDALFVERDTTVEELKEYVRRRASNPIIVGDNIVWNFSCYDVSERQLRRDLQNSRHTEYVIPFQVGGIWPQMFHLLPRRLKHAEVLVYHNQENEYRAYRQFLRDIPNEEEEEFRYQISMAVRNIGDNILTGDSE